jgi:hypothetical protein
VNDPEPTWSDRNLAAQHSPAALRCAILSIGGTGGAGSETARVHLAARRGGRVAARSAGATGYGARCGKRFGGQQLPGSVTRGGEQRAKKKPRNGEDQNYNLGRSAVIIQKIVRLSIRLRCEFRCRSGASSPKMSRLVSLGGALSIRS